MVGVAGNYQLEKFVVTAAVVVMASFVVACLVVAAVMVMAGAMMMVTVGRKGYAHLSGAAAAVHVQSYEGENVEGKHQRRQRFYEK